MKMLFSPCGPDDKILPDVAMLNKLSFNGFHVEFYDHEERVIKASHYPTTESIEARGFSDGFPNVYDFVYGLYDIYGDRVGIVKDNNSIVLYDNQVQMKSTAKEFGYNEDF